MVPEDLEDIENRISEIFISIGVAAQFLEKGVQLLSAATDGLREMKRAFPPTIPPSDAATGERARQD